MNKFNSYTSAMCAFALADCYEALRSVNPEIGSTYYRKLYDEIDAIRARQLQLSKIGG